MSSSFHQEPLDDAQIAAWLDAWRHYRDENTDMPTSAPDDRNVDLFMFYMLVLGYGGLEPDEFAMSTLDETLGRLDREELETLDYYLQKFHDYLIMMGVVK